MNHSTVELGKKDETAPTPLSWGGGWGWGVSLHGFLPPAGTVRPALTPLEANRVYI